MIRCVWEFTEARPDASGWREVRCQRCGYSRFTPYGLDRNHGNCQAWPFAHEIGYWCWLIFKAIGLDVETWSWLLRKLGLVKSCGCQKRAEAMNAFGQRIATAINHFGQTIRNWYNSRKGL